MASLYSGGCSAILLSALLCNCGPRHEGGGGEGDAGESASGGAEASGGTAGSPAAGGATSGGSGGSSSAGVGGTVVGGGSSAGSAAGGVSGGSSSPDAEPVLGCAAQSFPDAGSFYEPFNIASLPLRRQQLLRSFSAYELSADGKVVVGQTRDPDTNEFFPISWTLAGGVSAVPVATEGEGAGIKASCNGSVILVGDTPFDGVYRVDVPRWQYPLVIHGYLSFVSADPSASAIVTGRGQDREVGGEVVSYPRRWTAATGPVELRTLPNTLIHQTAADGTLVGSDEDELFRFYPATNSREPIGMSPVGGPESLAVSSSGYAWIQNADLNYDSFLVWREPAEPFSVTCPGRCTMVDLSSTGQIALLDITTDNVTSSWIWTEAGGFRQLSALLEQSGFDLRGRSLSAVAMSDDGRAFTGYSLSRDVPEGRDPLFFYAVLPGSTYVSR